MLKQLEALAQQRKEELVIFQNSKFRSIDELVKYMYLNVKAVVGAHGAAFYNARFCSSGTIVYEIMASKRFEPCFWEQSRIHQQEYLVHVAQSQGGAHDMRIDDVGAFVGFLRRKMQEMDKHYDPSQFLQKDHDFPYD